VVIYYLKQDNVRTNTESVQCHHVFNIVYLAPTLRGHVTNRFAIGQFLVVVHWNRSFISCRFKIFASKYNRVTMLNFLGHVTISVTWPLDSQYTISYPSSIVTKPLATALFEILGPKDNGVTTLTFLGHVTSSVIWPIDSPYAICYWLSIDTEALSLNVFEIFDPKLPCRLRIYTHSLTHSQTHNTPQVILYSVPCNALHWTDNYIGQEVLY